MQFKVHYDAGSLLQLGHQTVLSVCCTAPAAYLLHQVSLDQGPKIIPWVWRVAQLSANMFLLQTRHWNGSNAK